MNSFKKSIYKLTTSVAFYPPTVQASEDEELTSAQNSLTLTATETAPSGTIVSREWTEITGETGFTIVDPNNLTTEITGLTRDNYTFRITVTDSNGLTASDDVVITREEAVELSIATTATGTYDTAIFNGFEAGRTYEVSITPALVAGETLTLNYKMTVALYRSAEIDCDATGRTEIRKSGTSVNVLQDSLQPGEVGLIPAESITGSFVLYPGDTLFVEYDNSAQAITGESANATTEIAFESGTLSGSNRTITNLPVSKSFQLTNTGSTTT